MKISEIILYRCGAALPEVFGSATRKFERKDALFVEVKGDGLSGWGETGLAADEVAAFLKARGPSLLGRDATEIQAIWRIFKGGDRVATFAQSALDMALHDLVARGRGVSVAAYLGGARRDRVLAYASGPFMRPGGDPFRLHVRDMEAYLKRGFRAVKARAGGGAEADGGMAESLRKLIGPSGALMVDFNRSTAPAAAIAAARAMEGARLQWIEEPTKPEDLAGYLEVGRAVRPQIAGGEALITAAQFRPFLDARAFAVAQPDISNCGGFTGMGQVAALCAAANIPLVPHAFGGVVNFAATLQFAATLPSTACGGPLPYPWLEWSQLGDPMLSMLGEPPLDRDGAVAVPDGPGLGVDLSHDHLAPFIQGTTHLR